MIDGESPEGTIVRDTSNTFRGQATILVTILALMWLVEIIDWMTFSFTLDRYGIYPRTLVGLRNIFIAPFLHGGFTHLFANSAPFAILGWFVMLRRTQDFWWVSLFALLTGGLGVWLFAARNTIHIGASSLLFGYLGYLLFRGFLERSLQSTSLALLVIFLYGSMIWGVLPGQPGISWLGHLFGFIGGALSAYLLTER